MKYKRIFLIVLDSLGIGEAVDAEKYDDYGANTLEHICDFVNGLDVPTLEGLGLGNLGDFKGIYPLKKTLGTIARLEEVSRGKDTMTGHWEMMGLKVEKPFKTFTDNGFPEEFIKLFEEKTGRKCVGNYAESGTKIIDDWGEHQIKTGDWIVYTSADSVFQIAANEKYIPLEELYSACNIAREIAMRDEWKIGRVIARPFIGEKIGEFVRTANRHDLALKPFGKTVLDSLKENNIDVIGIGKISDIFVDQGISQKIKTTSNRDGMLKTIDLAKQEFNGLVFVNLVDFDALYGHRRDTAGYAQAIVEFDQLLEELLKVIKEDDLIMITADHGNDPTYKGTDHTRENVPLIMYSKKMYNQKNLGLLKSFAVIGATIADNFSVNNPGIGYSLMKEI
ncbi:MAG: phosphopentomutase [Bacilli bacterium]|nr:phosphopentomutase [Bacilli bacterium]